MRIAIVSALWQRPELTYQFLNYYAHMGLNGSDLVLIAAVSEEWDSVPGWTYVRVPNHPLGSKWNWALQLARESDPDIVFTVDSDDFITPEWFAQAITAHVNGADVVQPIGLYLGNLPTGELIYLPDYAPGPGRLHSRAVLERMEWQLWSDEQKSGLNENSRWRMGQRGIRVTEVLAEPGVILDIKGGGEQMWSFITFQSMARWEPVPQTLNEFCTKHFPILDLSVLLTALVD